MTGSEVKNGWLKAVARRTFFHDGAVRTIRFGPLKGARFRCGPITGLAPFYSGAERDHQRTTMSLLRVGDHAVDIGANWGLHTLLFSKLAGPQGRVLAVEPFDPARRELEWHVRANHCSNVTVVPLALSDREATARFAATGSAYTGHLVVEGADQGAANCDVVRAVQTTTLDLLLAREGFSSVQLVKLDVEGAESRVLQGAARVLGELRPCFVIELHTPEQDVAVARMLDQAGYSIERIAGPPIRRLDRGWPEPDGVWGTILARPR